MASRSPCPPPAQRAVRARWRGCRCAARCCSSSVRPPAPRVRGLPLPAHLALPRAAQGARLRWAQPRGSCQASNARGAAAGGVRLPSRPRGYPCLASAPLLAGGAKQPRCRAPRGSPGSSRGLPGPWSCRSKTCTATWACRAARRRRTSKTCASARRAQRVPTAWARAPRGRAGRRSGAAAWRLPFAASAAREPPRARAQAYRQAARKYHPDVNDSPDAKEKFQSINEAYQARAHAAPPPHAAPQRGSRRGG